MLSAGYIEKKYIPQIWKPCLHSKYVHHVDILKIDNFNILY